MTNGTNFIKTHRGKGAKMAKLAMNAGEAFVWYRSLFEQACRAGLLNDYSGDWYKFGNFYNVADEDGEEWLKHVISAYAYSTLCIAGKATSLDMTFKATLKHNALMSFGETVAAAWGVNPDAWPYGDAGLSLLFSFTSATNLRVQFGAGTAMVHGLEKMLPAYGYGYTVYTAKKTANFTTDATQPHEITASYDAKTGRLIVSVNGAEIINEIFSGAMPDSRFPTLEEWQPGYAGIFFGRDVQVKNLYFEYPTEGGEDEPDEDWRPLAEINRMGGDAPLFALLIESEGCEPLAIAQGYRDVWLKDANGEARLFSASGMTIELPERKAGSASALNFGVADVSGEALSRCEQLRDSAHPVYVTCLEYASHGGKSSEDAPEPVWHLRLFGTSAAITPKGATFSAGWHDTLNAKYPYRRYTAAQFPGLKYVSSSI